MASEKPRKSTPINPSTDEAAAPLPGQLDATEYFKKDAFVADIRKITAELLGNMEYHLERQKDFQSKSHYPLFSSRVVAVILTGQLGKPGKDAGAFKTELEKAKESITYIRAKMATELKIVTEYVKQFTEFRKAELEKADAIVLRSESMSSSK